MIFLLIYLCEVPRAQRAGYKTFGLLLYRIGLLSVWATFALPGVILNGPVFLLAKLISQQKAKRQLLSICLFVTDPCRQRLSLLRQSKLQGERY